MYQTRDSTRRLQLVPGRFAVSPDEDRERSRLQVVRLRMPYNPRLQADPMANGLASSEHLRFRSFVHAPCRHVGRLNRNLLYGTQHVDSFNHRFRPKPDVHKGPTRHPPGAPVFDTDRLSADR